MRQLITSLLLVSCFTISAQVSLDKRKLDSYFDALQANDKAMLSVAISENGESIYQKSIGFASNDKGKRNNADTKFRIGSITKVFTTTMIFQLIEEGKLSLETKLSTYYPKVKNASKITISHLLSHRSGIHNFTNDPSYVSYLNQPKSKTEMIALIESLDSDFEPGSKADYSNSAFVLLGYIIQDITGSSYAQQLNARIVNKLGLERTEYGGQIDTNDNQASSYTYNSESWVSATVTDMSIPGGAGAIISSPTEINKFMQGLFGGQLVSNKSLSKMKEINEGYGRGLFKIPFYNKFAYGHTGGIDGFSSNAAYFENEKIAVSVTSNGMNYVMNDIMIGILSLTFGKPFDIPNFSAKAISISAENLKKYEGVFASSAFPLKITIKVDGNTLIAQATGQSAFPLTSFSNIEFRYKQAGIVIKFGQEGKTVDYSTFTLNQGGGQYVFKKE